MTIKSSPLPPFHPKVSIVIPVYNGSNYMREAIDSALAQIYDNIEIIVVNDGSTDNTESIALSYGNKIRYFAKKNSGQSTALNLGIEKMTGEYFSWLSHDDLYYQNKVEIQIKTLDKLENKDTFLYSAYTTIDCKGKIIGHNYLNDSNQYELCYSLIRNNPINGNSVLISKNVFKKVGAFNQGRPHTSDTELFFKISRIFPTYYIHQRLILSRNHPSQATHRNYAYHIYESGLCLIDCLNSLTNLELQIISKGKQISSILSELALKWSTGGYGSAYRLVLYRLQSTTDINRLGLFNLKFRCHYRYNQKILKRLLKKWIRYYLKVYNK